jgi:Rieske Fe-S protein
VATGFRKWGFTTAAVAARIIADLVAGRESPWRSVFDSERVPHDPRSLVAAVKGNVDVARHFVADRLRIHRAPALDQLERGQGRIVEVGGTRAAAYRDPAGELHLCSPRCTHLGCVVVWNAGERSWDCPCHGSRFAPDGAVLTGPAVAPLAPVEVAEPVVRP